MRAHRSLSLWHVAWLAMAVCALAQRPPVVDDSSDESSSLTRSQLIARIALAAPGGQLKRTTWAAGHGTLVLPASLAVVSLGLTIPQTQRDERSEATTPASRARLTAHPPNGPPAV